MARRVCIIGGGVIGLASAYAWGRAGMEVTLVEAQKKLGNASSFANGGQLSYRYVTPLADAGVPLQGGGTAGIDVAGTSAVMWGVALALVLGKPLGVLLSCWLAVRLRMCALPPGMGWGDTLLAGLLAGIGFTMAIFIATLAFDSEALPLPVVQARQACDMVQKLALRQADPDPLGMRCQAGEDAVACGQRAGSGDRSAGMSISGMLAASATV